MNQSHRIKGGILAAGRGERLRDSGTLKPLITIAERPLIAHVLDGFADLGATDVTIIINQESGAVRDATAEREWPFALRWMAETTPSSMHSFLRLIEALAADGSGGPFVLSTVDTILPPHAFATFCSNALNNSENDVTLAINQPAEDDNPLWVRCDERGRVIAIGEDAATDATGATAGIYIVNSVVLREAETARRDALMSLRSFLGRLFVRGYHIGALPIANSIDVDRVADIIAAEKLLQQHQT
jgi:NDP-sugar pyrophosphorylase family protein